MYLPSKALAASTKFDQSKSAAESGRGMSPGSGMGCLLCSWISVRELSEAENSPEATQSTNKQVKKRIMILSEKGMLNKEIAS